MIGYVYTLIRGHDLNLATRDYGGPASLPILLLHGAGRSLADWQTLIPRLMQNHRIVAMDLREHGPSDAGPWSIASLQTDIAAVLRYYKMPTAALVGHSMGGVLAHLYAEAHPETTAVINFDGFSLMPRQHIDLAEDECQRRWMRVRAEQNWTPSRLSSDQFFKAIEETATRFNIDLQAAAEIFYRTTKMEEDEFYVFRQDKISLDGVRWLYENHLQGRNLFESIQTTAVRCLIFQASLNSIPDNMPDWMRELYAAYFGGVSKELQRIGREPHVTVEQTNADHFMILSHPDQLASRIQTFLAHQ